MLKIRILSALLGIPLIMLVLYFGGKYLYIFAAAVSLIGLFEYYRAMSNISIYTNKVFGYISVVLYYIMFLLPITFSRPGFLIALSVITLLTCEIIRQKGSIAEISVNILGITYIPFLFSHILFIEKLNYGNVLVWLPFLTAWFTDTSAYFIGIYMGKIKRAQESARKTRRCFGRYCRSSDIQFINRHYNKQIRIDIRLIHFTTGFLCGIALSLVTLPLRISRDMQVLKILET